MKAFVSSQISSAVKRACGIDVLPLEPYDKLDLPVASHADMLVFAFEGAVFCYNDYYLNNKSIFDEAEKCGYKIIRVKSECDRKYPNDISLNVLKIGDALIGNLKHTAPEILRLAEEKCYKLINVKQGYSACATLVLNDKNAITADPSIYNALKLLGVDVLLINPNGIDLEGYNCGFIGGASFVFENTVYFFGDIKSHPSYNEIHDKIVAVGMTEKTILSRYVYDFGGIRTI